MPRIRTPKVMIRSSVSCACGCGETFIDFDGDGRLRRFVSGHNTTSASAKEMRARLAARPDAREVLSNGGKKAWSNPDYRLRMIESGRRQWADPVFREKTLAAARNAIKLKWAQDTEYRIKMIEIGKASMAERLKDTSFVQRRDAGRSKRLLELWKTPEWISKIKATHANQCGTTRTSKPEKRLRAFLDSLGQVFEPNKRFVLDRGYTMPDAYITSLNLAIFTDGSYWHGKPEKKKRDSEQRSALEQIGVRVFVIDQGQPEPPQFEALSAVLKELLCQA